MTIPTKSYLEKGAAVAPGVDQPLSTADDQVLIVHAPQFTTATVQPRSVCCGGLRTSADRHRHTAYLALLCVVLINALVFAAWWAAWTSSDLPDERNFHSFCAIPYSGADAGDDIDAQLMDLLPRMHSLNIDADDDDLIAERQPDNNPSWRAARLALRDNSNVFVEKFDLSSDVSAVQNEEGYTRVTVPEYRDGRHGQFLHDFKYNQSLIVDRPAGNCFLMPLDRATVLRPTDMIDLLVKMMDGYYNIDTELVKRTMRVVIPPMTDTSEVAERIVQACEGMRLFRLEPFTGRVFKRSVDQLSTNGKFAHFSGRKLVELDFVNYAQVEQFLAANRK